MNVNISWCNILVFKLFSNKNSLMAKLYNTLIMLKIVFMHVHCIRLCMLEIYIVVIITLAILLNLLYILIKLISTYHMLTIDNLTTYCHNSELQLISITLLQIHVHIRSYIYEIDPFLHSGTRMCWQTVHRMTNVP